MLVRLVGTTAARTRTPALLRTTPARKHSFAMTSTGDSTMAKLRNRFSTLGQPKEPQPQKQHSSAESTFVVPKGIDYSSEARSLRPKAGLRDLYPAVEPFKTGMLAVDDTHEVYWEACGNPEGAPVIFLHGGPGGGCSPSDRRFFDAKHYCIYLMDQRGSGRSKPHAELRDNTTWHLVADIEKLREHVGVDKWHTFGGSWGSCLCLAYAQSHPDRVTSLVLRGIFTLRRSELLFFYQDGASHLFPEQFEAYREHIPVEERADMMAAYYKRLTGDDEAERVEAAKCWSTWENATSKIYTDEEYVRKGKENAKWALAFARIEAHYFVNGGWMTDGQLLKRENVDKIRHIPASIVQGRYDVVCPATTAYDLHRQWPEATFHLIPDNGHSAREIGIQHALLDATDKMRTI